MVLSVDEKTQIQALDRTQPMLPLKPGQIERRTHDYTRHGTRSLYAAFDVATGQVRGRVTQRNRGVEFLAFLRQIERSTRRSRPAPDPRQQQHPRHARYPQLALQASPLPSPFYPDQRLLAQRRRKLVLPADAARSPARCSRTCRGRFTGWGLRPRLQSGRATYPGFTEWELPTRC